MGNEQSQSTPEPECPMKINLATLGERYKGRSRRLVMLDYDGTLSPIVTDPSMAVPTEALIDTLENLTSDTSNAVYIISGRDQDFLDKHFGHINGLGLSAEHGCFLRKPYTTDWVNLAEKVNMTFEIITMEVLEAYTKSTPGSRIERKKVGITWHYREALPKAWAKEQAERVEEELKRLVVPWWDVEVMCGKMNVEVRPRDISKGAMVKKLVDEYGETADKVPNFVFCAGDDTTDEDMFKELQKSNLDGDGVFTVKVGSNGKSTVAHYAVKEPDQLIEALGSLVA